jgi:hypothetical protein
MEEGAPMFVNAEAAVEADILPILTNPQLLT